MTEKYIRLDDVMTIIARKHLFKDKTDFDKCVHAIAEQIKALQTVEAVPLSVIEKIKAEIDNDRLCYAEELQKPLKKKHTLYELKEYTARQELLSMKCAICQDVLDIIDKAVKECTHE